MSLIITMNEDDFERLSTTSMPSASHDDENDREEDDSRPTMMDGVRQ